MNIKKSIILAVLAIVTGLFIMIAGPSILTATGLSGSGNEKPMVLTPAHENGATIVTPEVKPESSLRRIDDR